MTDDLNLFTPPDELAGELTEVLARGTQVRIERIVSRGHQTPTGQWYDQDEHEWVALIAGNARLAFDDGTTRELAAGDHILIPAHLRHRVDWTTPTTNTIWLAVFFRNA